MWYNLFSKFLQKKRHKNDPIICPCVFIRRFEYETIVIFMYLDDLNIIDTLKEFKNYRVFKERIWNERS